MARHRGGQRFLDLAMLGFVLLDRGTRSPQLPADVGEASLEVGDGLGARNGQLVGRGRRGRKRRREFAALSREFSFQLCQLVATVLRLFPIRDEVGFVGEHGRKRCDIARHTDLGQIFSGPFEVRGIAVSLGGELGVRGRSLAAFVAQAVKLRACCHIDREGLQIVVTPTRVATQPTHGQSAAASPHAVAGVREAVRGPR